MRPSVIFATLFGVAGVAILCWLGVWQLHRLEWKEAILADIEARITAAPVVLPDHADPVDDRYLPVEVRGKTDAREILVQASHKAVGPGFRVITGFTTDGGRRILLDRGFIRLADRDTSRPAVEMTVTGNLHWPDEVDGFTPDPDRDEGLWFARDIPSLSDELGTEPLLIVARSTDEGVPAVTPLPVDTTGIPNDHLQYAITWFLLAAVWAVMSVYLIVTLLRRAEENN